MLILLKWFHHGQNYNENEQYRWYFIDAAIKFFFFQITVPGKILADFGQIAVEPGHPENQHNFGMQPALFHPVRAAYDQRNAKDEGHNHGRAHDIAQQSLLHQLEGAVHF